MKWVRTLLCLVLSGCVLLCSLPLPAMAAVPDVSTAPETSAKAFLVLEAGTRTVLFSKNADDRLPMASTTKILTTLLCIESGDLDTRFPVDSDAIRVEGSSMGLVEGDLVTKRALCYGMLLPSGNDAAGAAAVRIDGSYAAFAERMNARAAEIGMTNSHFVTPSGLHDDDHYSTAYDMALLTAEALQNETFREICKQPSAVVSFGNPPYERRLDNSNRLLTMCPGVIGVKTGFTDEAGRCLVSACVRNGITLICVTLNDRDDWNDHQKLYDAAFPLLEPKTLPLPETLRLPVAGSDAETVALCAKEPVTIGVLPDAATHCAWHVEAAPFLFAPVQQGTVAGYLVYTCKDFVICRQPLYAATAVDRAAAD